VEFPASLLRAAIRRDQENELSNNLAGTIAGIGFEHHAHSLAKHIDTTPAFPTDRKAQLEGFRYAPFTGSFA
jgi:hypothetical protein